MDPQPRVGPLLLVHTGAWDVPAEARAAHLAGARRAVEAGWRVLDAGGSARAGAVVAVTTMEDDPELNAGRGSVLCREGFVECDAAVMDGAELLVGAVACVRDVANPVRLADALLGGDEILLVGEAASRAARSHGIATVDAASLVLPRERERLAAWAAVRGPAVPPDTVGAVALDAEGHLAAATSTGGRPGKPSGRVGDAPIAGAGLFADDRLAAVAATGRGERVLRFGLARRAAELGRDHSAQDACWLALREMQERVGGQAGLVLIARDGSLGWGFDTPAMGVAYMAGDLAAPVVAGIPS